MAESGADGAASGNPGQAPGKGLIRVTVKTPKDKEEIVIGETACVREVRLHCGWWGSDWRRLRLDGHTCGSGSSLGCREVMAATAPGYTGR